MATSTNPMDTIESSLNQTPPVLATIERKRIASGDIPESITISSSAEYSLWFERLRGENALRKEIIEAFEPMKSAAHKAHAVICEQERKYLKAQDDRIAPISKAIVTWDDEQEAARQERERQETENARALQAADAQRMSDEMKEAGQPELAAQVLQAAAEEAPLTRVHVPSSTPKVAGGFIKRRTKVHVDSERDVILGYARPIIMQEIAAWLEKEFKASGKKLAGAIRVMALAAPTVPSSAISVSEGALTTFVNRETGGRVLIPGCSAETDAKPVTTQRGR